MIAILMDVKLYLIVILILISLMTIDVEHLFMCLLTIHKFLWRNVYLRLLPIFELGYLLLWCGSSLHILDIKPLSDICFANIFFHPVDCPFSFLTVSSAMQKF